MSKGTLVTLFLFAALILAVEADSQTNTSGFTPAPAGLGLTTPSIPSFSRPFNAQPDLSALADSFGSSVSSTAEELPDGCDDVEDEVSSLLSASTSNAASSSTSESLNQGLAAVSGAAGGAKSAALVPALPKCPAVPAGAPKEEVTCDALSTAGKFNFDRLHRKKISACAAVAALSCRERSITDLNRQTKLIQSEQANLDQQLKSISSTFNQNVARFNDDMADMGAMARKADQILKGNGANASEGLLAVRDEANKRLREWEPEIRLVKQGYDNVDFQQKWLATMVRRSRDGLVRSCMTEDKRSPLAKCARNGELKDNVSYLTCRLEQQARKDSKGNTEQLRKEERREDAIRGVGGSSDALTIIKGVFASFPPDSTIPEPPVSTPGAATPPGIFYTNRFQSAADIDLKFGRRLDQFQINLGSESPTGEKGTVSLRTVFAKMLNACYAEADRQIAAEGGGFDAKGNLVIKSTNGKEIFSRITVVQNGIKNLEEETKVRFNQLEFDYKGLINRTRTALTGISLPLPSSKACENADRAQQIKCLSDKRDEMRDLFEGNTPRVAGKILLPGAKNQSGAVINCQGISGCITKLQRAGETLSGWMADYSREAKKSTDKFMDSTRQAYAPLCGQPAARVNYINAALGAVGDRESSSRLRLSTVDRSEGVVGVDQQGLPRAPENFTAAVCGGGTTPFVKIDTNDLAELSGEIGRNASAIRDKKAEATIALNSLDGKETECVAKNLEDLDNNRLKAQLDALQTNACGSIEKLCAEAGRGELSRIADEASQLFGELGDANASVAALAGAGGICDDLKPLREEIAKLRTDVAGLQDEVNGTPNRAIASKLKPEDKAKLERDRSALNTELTGINAKIAELEGDKTATMDARKDALVKRPTRQRSKIAAEKAKTENLRRDIDSNMSVVNAAIVAECARQNGAAFKDDIEKQRQAQSWQATTSKLQAWGINPYEGCETLRSAVFAARTQNMARVKELDAEMDAWDAYDQGKQDYKGDSAVLAKNAADMADQEREKSRVEGKIAAINRQLGESSADKVGDAVVVQQRVSLEKKQDELDKKEKQLSGGGTGEQRGGGSLAKCRALASDVQKTLGEMKKVVDSRSRSAAPSR